MGIVAEAPVQEDLRDQPLEDLMRRYQQADHDAATQLVRLVSPPLLRYLIARVSNRSTAEDLLQDCWLRIHKARHTYRPGEPLLPWIFAIARHTRVDSYRRARRIESHEVAIADVNEPAGSPQADPVGSVMVSALLNQLPESQREVVFLLKVEGMSIEDIARANSTTVGAVKQKAHRAYAKLREILSKDSGHSGK